MTETQDILPGEARWIASVSPVLRFASLAFLDLGSQGGPVFHLHGVHRPSSSRRLARVSSPGSRRLISLRNSLAAAPVLRFPHGQFSNFSRD